MPEPQQGEPQACQDTEQQELEPAHVLASLQALQLDLDFCRGRNCKRLVQLQQQECVVEQKHQDLVFLMQHYQEVIGKVPLLGAVAVGQVALSHMFPAASSMQLRHHPCPTALPVRTCSDQPTQPQNKAGIVTTTQWSRAGGLQSTVVPLTPFQWWLQPS